MHALRMGRFQVIVTSWTYLYLTVLNVWAIVIAANQIRNKDNWRDTLGVELDGANWVHVAGAVGLGSGITAQAIMICAFLWACGDWKSVCSPWARVARIVFELAVQLASICVIGLASIYFYVQKDSQLDIHGLSYSTILGGIFLALVVLNQLLFTPSMMYIQMMASPCMYPATRNCRMNTATGQFISCRSVYSAHLSRILDVLPYFGNLGNDNLEFNGVPVVLLASGSYDADQKNHFKSAAQVLVDQLTDMYGLSDASI